MTAQHYPVPNSKNVWRHTSPSPVCLRDGDKITLTLLDRRNPVTQRGKELSLPGISKSHIFPSNVQEVTDHLHQRFSVGVSSTFRKLCRDALNSIQYANSRYNRCLCLGIFLHFILSVFQFISMLHLPLSRDFRSDHVLCTSQKINLQSCSCLRSLPLGQGTYYKRL